MKSINLKFLGPASSVNRIQLFFGVDRLLLESWQGTPVYMQQLNGCLINLGVINRLHSVGWKKMDQSRLVKEN